MCVGTLYQPCCLAVVIFSISYQLIRGNVLVAGQICEYLFTQSNTETVIWRVIILMLTSVEIACYLLHFFSARVCVSVSICYRCKHADFFKMYKRCTSILQCTCCNTRGRHCYKTRRRQQDVLLSVPLANLLCTVTKSNLRIIQILLEFL